MQTKLGGYKDDTLRTIFLNDTYDTDIPEEVHTLDLMSTLSDQLSAYKHFGAHASSLSDSTIRTQTNQTGNILPLRLAFASDPLPAPAEM